MEEYGNNRGTKIMNQEKNIIYPEEQKLREQSYLKALLIALAGLLIIGGLYWFGTRSKKEELPPPVQGDVSIQAGFFTVSQSLRRITIEKGETKSIDVKITIIPLEGFKEPVTFAVDDILKNNVSVKKEGTLNIKFSPSKLESKDFEKGAVLTITPSKEVAIGQYGISYRVQSRNIAKNFFIPIVVQ